MVGDVTDADFQAEVLDSDRPVCRLTASYAEVISTARELTAGLQPAERHEVFTGTVSETCTGGAGGNRTHGRRIMSPCGCFTPVRIPSLTFLFVQVTRVTTAASCSAPVASCAALSANL